MMDDTKSINTESRQYCKQTKLQTLKKPKPHCTEVHSLVGRLVHVHIQAINLTTNQMTEQ